MDGTHALPLFPAFRARTSNENMVGECGSTDFGPNPVAVIYGSVILVSRRHGLTEPIFPCQLPCGSTTSQTNDFRNSRSVFTMGIVDPPRTPTCAGLSASASARKEQDPAYILKIARRVHQTDKEAQDTPI